MCKVCTEAVHSVALWTRVTLGLDMCKVCTEAVHSVALWTRVTLGLDMCKVCTEAVHSVALWTRVTLGLDMCKVCTEAVHSVAFRGLGAFRGLFELGWPLLTPQWKRTRLFSSCFFFFLPSARRMPNIFHGLRRKMREIFRKCAWRSLAVTCGHLPSAVSCGHSSGCRLCAATCGHLRSLEWLQVAASGWFSQNQIPRSLRAQWIFRFLSWRLHCFPAQVWGKGHWFGKSMFTCNYLCTIRTYAQAPMATFQQLIS